MKVNRFFFSVIALCCTMVVGAQNEVMYALLQHGNDVTAFQGSTAFKNAVDAADDGDVITLSQGVFTGEIFIKKSDSYHLVHDDVVFVGWNNIEFLKGKADAYLVSRGYLGEKSVVVALSTAKSVALIIKAHTGHQCHIDSVKCGKRSSAWFLDVELVLAHVIGAMIETKFHLVVG